MTTWKDRALAATKGSRFGAILAAALDEQIPAPCFSGSASITSDGFVMASFTDKNGEHHFGAFVGAASDLANNARGLAKHLDLNDEDRDALFATIKGWVGNDYSNGTALKL